MELIDALAQETADMPLHVQTDRVIKDSGLRTMYEPVSYTHLDVYKRQFHKGANTPRLFPVSGKYYVPAHQAEIGIFAVFCGV